MAQEERPHQKTTESIKRLYTQIRKMPELTSQAQIIDQVLLNKLKEMKGTASVVVAQINQQKKTILKRFDNWVMPIAKEVLDRFLQDAEQLKEKLDDKIDHLEETTPDDWNAQAVEWAKLYERWNDRKWLIDKILQVVSDRTKSLIDKDIQVIQEYQTQSIAHLPKESEVLKDIERRLNFAIAEPLKQLEALRNHQKETTTLKQASEWVAKLHEKRENYFDQLLMKIDHVTKEVVQPHETIDLSSAQELQGEILFMERELQQIEQDHSHLHPNNEADRQFIAARLEGLLDHIEQIDNEYLPTILKERLQQLKSRSTELLKKID